MKPTSDLFALKPSEAVQTWELFFVRLRHADICCQGIASTPDQKYFVSDQPLNKFV